jgi:uncharacterized protein (TIGR03437 family)
MRIPQREGVAKSLSTLILPVVSRASRAIYKTSTIILHAGLFRSSYDGLVIATRIIPLGLFLSIAVFGQAPVIAPNGVVNGATFAPGPVAPGSIASIFGTNLAGSLTQASTVPLSTALADVTVTINGKPAPLYFVSPDQPGNPGSAQINIQIPYDVLSDGTTSGSVNLTVNRTTAGSSQPSSVQIAPVAPGILQTNGQAIAINNADGTIAAAPGSVPGLTTHAATAGDVLILYATGLGAVTPTVANGAASTDQLRKTNVTPTVMIGGVQAQVLFSGLTPQFTGVNQVNIVVPSGITPGNNVPIQIMANSILTSNQVIIAIK